MPEQGKFACFMLAIWNFIRKLPHYLWLILAGVGGLLLLLFSARRRGEKIGKAKGEAIEATRTVEVLSERATEAIKKNEEVKRNPSATNAEREKAEEEVRSTSDALHDDILRRIRGE